MEWFVHRCMPGETFMESYRVAAFGIEALERTTLPIPEAGPGSVVVRIHAVSLNYRDLMTVEGRYNPKMALPRIPCSDGAGEVVAVGAGVDRVAVGDRVCTLFFQGWMDGAISADKTRGALGGDVDGALAEYVALGQDGVIPFPEHLTYEEAATLPCAGLTAWNALHHAGMPASPAAAGDTVLIQGTGGVSLFTLQFAKLAGMTVYGTSSSDEKLARAAAMGLDGGCNYRETPEWSGWVADVTERHGVNRVIEVGGAGTFAQSLEAAGFGGLIAQIGVLSGGVATGAVPLTQILRKQLRVQGIYVGSRAMFAEMNEAIGTARLRPVVDQVYPFAEAREALTAMKSGQHFGKIVIRVASA
jgi:NADPH:quinone reductase-like Zn-dependent oxidoreductase